MSDDRSLPPSTRRVAVPAGPAHRHPAIIRRAAWLLLLAGLAAGTPALAAGANTGATVVATSDPCTYAANDRLSLLDDRLTTLKQKLALQASQEKAWKTWADTVRADVGKQSADECRINMKWWSHAEDDNEDLATPDRMKRQESGLREEIAMMQGQLDRIEAAEKNTAPFYAALDRKQKTIFDLFWRLEHATGFRPTHPGHAFHGMMPPCPAWGDGKCPAMETGPHKQ